MKSYTMDSQGAQSSLKERIAEQLKDHLTTSGLFLVDVKVTPRDKVMVYVDGKNNITIDQCVDISRMLEGFLEAEKLVRDDYILEVSSPGMGQPFKVREQYFKAIGQGLEILRNDGEKLEGVLDSADDNGITLRIDKTKPTKNKQLKPKVISSELVEIAFDEIKTTKQLITFK